MASFREVRRSHRRIAGGGATGRGVLESLGIGAMTMRKGFLLMMLAAFWGASLSGCEMLHEMQPHRLWKLNHGMEGMPSDDYSLQSGDRAPSAYFASVPDDVNSGTQAAAP